MIGKTLLMGQGVSFDLTLGAQEVYGNWPAGRFAMPHLLLLLLMVMMMVVVVVVVAVIITIAGSVSLNCVYYCPVNID